MTIQRLFYIIALSVYAATIGLFLNGYEVAGYSTGVVGMVLVGLLIVYWMRHDGE